MTTDTPAKPSLNAETLYPLLKRAQDLGAPLSVTEPDDEGDLLLKVFDETGDELIDDVVYKNNNFDRNEQYIVMGVLMDWLSRLAREAKCDNCAEAQQAMGRAWATGGFVPMLEAFNENVDDFSIYVCAERLRAGVGQPDNKKPDEPTPEQLRIKELEGQLADRESKLKRLRAVELLLFNEVEQVDESLGSYVITVKKRMTLASLMGSYPLRIGLGLSVANDPEAVS